jgi:DNA-binding PadR family transcriptional regulator
VASRDARPQRRYYEITAAGAKALESALEPVRALGGRRSLTPKAAK